MFVLFTIIFLLATSNNTIQADSLRTHTLLPEATFTFDETRYIVIEGCMFAEANYENKPVGDFAITVFQGHSITLQADPNNIATIHCVKEPSWKNHRLVVVSNSPLFIPE